MLGKWGLLSRVGILFVSAKKGYVAVTIHNLKQSDYKWFEEVIDLIKDHYSFLDPERPDEGRDSNENHTLKVLLTFDDGFRSSYIVAKDILKPRQIRAIYFIPRKFIALRDNQAIKFAQNYFYPSRKIDESERGEYDAMDWNEIFWLREQGHIIGAHTDHHLAISSLSATEKYKQIVESADLLEQKLGQAVHQFAYPFGSLATVDQEAVNLVKDRFSVAYSNVRGMMEESPSSHFVFRQNLVPGMPLWLVMAAIEGRLDWRYRNVRHEAQTRFRTLESNQ